jgi:hypothetical protein
MGAQMVEHLRIDRPGRTAQRQFAQRAQVRLGKKWLSARLASCGT